MTFATPERNNAEFQKLLHITEASRRDDTTKAMLKNIVTRHYNSD